MKAMRRQRNVAYACWSLWHCALADAVVEEAFLAFATLSVDLSQSWPIYPIFPKFGFVLQTVPPFATPFCRPAQIGFVLQWPPRDRLLPVSCCLYSSEIGFVLHDGPVRSDAVRRFLGIRSVGHPASQLALFCIISHAGPHVPFRLRPLGNGLSFAAHDGPLAIDD
jgi:hypothetical protein